MKRDDALMKVDEGLAELSNALSAGHSVRLTRYLEVMSRFHRYSFGNVMLILCQFPEATHVAGFSKWKKLGRHVTKGESGIGILAPLTYKTTDDDGEEARTIRGFKVVHVFDVTQTEGEDLPDLATVTGDSGDNVQRIEQVIRDQNIELCYEPLPRGALGQSSDGTITVVPELEEAERFAILVHEYAHELLHKGERRQETTKKIRETEAEAVAFVVCRALGLDSHERSSDYIALYRGSTETLSESLDFIQKTSAGILDSLHRVDLADQLDATTERSVKEEVEVTQSHLGACHASEAVHG